MNKPDINIAVRGWKNGEQIFEDLYSMSWEEDVEGLLERAAENHAERLGDGLHMIEIEFLDEPDPDQRFFRIGTDPRRMVLPMRVN
jgi:hypothetical protein